MFLLLIASASTMISGAALQNHRKLVQAVGPLLSIRPKGAATMDYAQKLHPKALGKFMERLFENTFSSAVSASCFAALLARAVVST
jgi:hypothetical protein